MSRTIIVIPIYKETPDSYEALSLRQCLKVLCAYSVVLVCPSHLDTNRYNVIAGSKLNTERFDAEYFDGIEGYNRLMQSQQFYKRFSAYDYMLIYQLDAWVFTDQLKEWCDKGYDYVGAPWFGEWLSHEEGEELTDCGNGGLSLRRISKFIEITDPDTKVMTKAEILQRYFCDFKTWDKGIERLLGFKNNIRWHLRKNSHLWEDAYFCRSFDGLQIGLKRPDALEAAAFSFDKSPAYLYSLIKQLPFGCHAWRKYEYDTFWNKFIKE